MEFSTFFSPRLILRPLQMTDAAGILDLRSDPELNRFLEREPLTHIGEAEGVIEHLLSGVSAGAYRYWVLAEKNTSALIGTLCLWHFAEDGKSADIGYELKKEFQGKGYMSEAVEALLRTAFTHMNVEILYAETHQANIPSLKLLQRNGFTDISDSANTKAPMLRFALTHTQWITKRNKR